MHTVVACRCGENRSDEGRENFEKLERRESEKSSRNGNRESKKYFSGLARALTVERSLARYRNIQSELTTCNEVTVGDRTRCNYVMA